MARTALGGLAARTLIVGSAKGTIQNYEFDETGPWLKVCSQGTGSTFQEKSAPALPMAGTNIRELVYSC